jgi:hypothetical protein
MKCARIIGPCWITVNENYFALLPNEDEKSSAYYHPCKKNFYEAKRRIRCVN